MGPEMATYLVRIEAVGFRARGRLAIATLVRVSAEGPLESGLKAVQKRGQPNEGRNFLSKLLYLNMP